MGDPVTGTPYNGVALTYALSGKAKDSGLFTIDSATGQISVATGANIDYETDDNHREIEYWPPDSQTVFSKFYPGKVNYTVNGHASSIEVLIKITDVDDTRASISTITRTQFSKPTDPALDVTWVAPTQPPWTVTGYNVQYRKQGDTAWTAYTGTLAATDTTVNLPGLELGATYEVQVRALGTGEDEVGGWSEIATRQANRAPRTIAGPAKRDVKWYGTTGVRLEYNDVHFADDDGDKLTFAPDDDYPGLLQLWIKTLDSGLRELWIAGWNPYEGVKTVNFHAHDGYGGTASNIVKTTIWIPEEIRTVAENSPAGVNLGAPLTGRPYGDETYTYSLTGEAAGVFTIDESTGQVTVAEIPSVNPVTGEPVVTAPNLDFETKTSYTGKVEFTVQGQPAAIPFTINLTDVETPTPGAPSVSRHSGSPRSALRVSWNAPSMPAGTPITGYALQYKRPAESSWTDKFHSGTGTSATIDSLSSGTTYQVRVLARSSEGPSDWSSPGQGRTRSRPDRDDPTPDPTPEPTPTPTPGPSPGPTPEATPEPTPGPTPPAGTPGPTPGPTVGPTLVPTPHPTFGPTPESHAAAGG